MARKKSKGKSRRSKKVEPMNTTLRFPNQTVPAAGTKTVYVDMMQCASILNRKFLRQGLNVAVSGIKVLSSTGVVTSRAEGSIIVSKLPTTWVMANAWVKALAVWQEMQDRAIDDAGMESIKGRYLDFKLYADATHHQAGYAANLLPVAGGSAIPATAGEWTPSTVDIPASDSSSLTSFELIAVGPNMPGVGASGYNAKSVIQGYADGRALPYTQDPNVPVDASLNWMAAVFNEGTLQANAVIGDLEVNGDQPPYPFEGDGLNIDTMYPGGETQLPSLQYHALEYITSSTIGGTTRFRGGQFPCGLVRLDIFNTNPDDSMDVAIEIELVPGHHRGLLAEPMQEMN
ncbi:MAG: hypothetical protein [Circular genetic element sp.]|nr:MAG: hypothetical protein [Circular genetic element sp.]